MTTFYPTDEENILIKYDKETKRSETIDILYLNEKKAEYEARLAELSDYSDEALLAWAKKNYPTPELLKEKEQLERELQNITNLLNEIDGN